MRDMRIFSNALSRRLRTAVLLALVPAATMAGPADAHANTCVVAGTVSLSEGLYYMPDYRFNVWFDGSLIGPCVFPPPSMPIHGWLTQASCGNSIGGGRVYHGYSHSFSLGDAGGVWILAGEVNGSLLAIPQGSCLNDGTHPGVSSFLLAGSITMV